MIAIVRNLKKCVVRTGYIRKNDTCMAAFPLETITNSSFHEKGARKEIYISAFVTNRMKFQLKKCVLEL